MKRMRLRFSDTGPSRRMYRRQAYPSLNHFRLPAIFDMSMADGEHRIASTASRNSSRLIASPFSSKQ